MRGRRCRPACRWVRRPARPGSVSGSWQVPQYIGQPWHIACRQFDPPAARTVEANHRTRRRWAHADRYQGQVGLGGGKRRFLFASPAIERLGAQAVTGAVRFLCQVALLPRFKMLLPVCLAVPSCHLRRLSKTRRLLQLNAKLQVGRLGAYPALSISGRNGGFFECIMRIASFLRRISRTQPPFFWAH